MTIKQTPVQVNGSEVIAWEDSKEAGVTISYSGGGWMPGIFDSVASAALGAAVIFKDEIGFVNCIQKEVNNIHKQNRNITTQDLIEFMVMYWSP